MRNPLYVGNFITALGFAVAFTGENSGAVRATLVVGALGAMIGVYSVVVPHEERYLRSTFGAEFDEYVAAVPRVVPRTAPGGSRQGAYDPAVIGSAESRTFLTFGAMCVALAVKALKK